MLYDVVHDSADRMGVPQEGRELWVTGLVLVLGLPKRTDALAQV